MKFLSFFSIIVLLAACGLLNGGGNGARTIVFSANANSEGVYQIFTMREDGSGVKQLTDGKYSSTNPAWSSDGSRIAYARSTGSTAGETLWVMDADGENRKPLVTNPQTSSPQLGNHPDWSPDGTRIAFDRCLNCELGGSNHEIFFADLQTGAVDTLTEHPVADRQPAWSPDGKQIAFISGRDYADADTMRWRNDLYLVNMTGSNLKRLTISGFIGSYAWLSSDSLIYVIFDPNTQLKNLVILNIKTGDQNSIIKNLQVNQFWIFWDPFTQQLFTINKKHQEIPVTIQVFDIKGNLLKQQSLTNSVLKSALSFKWKITQ